MPLLDRHTLLCPEITKEASSITHLTATCCRSLSMHQNTPGSLRGIIWMVGRSSPRNLYATSHSLPLPISEQLQGM